MQHALTQGKRRYLHFLKRKDIETGVKNCQATGQHGMALLG
jgi:hypothetical protein